MVESCTNCGGELKVEGSGFKCSFCGTKFASAEELHPGRAKPSIPQTAPIAIPTVSKSDHGVDVFDTNINGVLEITWSDGQYKHSGSGFLISPDGYAVTNTHVVTHENGKSCEQVSVRLCGETTTAIVLKLGDNKHGDGNGVDLALIQLSRVPRNATVVAFEDFNNVRSGERVFVIGNSLGHGTCITSGIVSDKMRNVNGKMLLMTDCAVNGGNSGGPIFNERGLVVGAVVSGIASAEGMNFAIPSSAVIQFIQNNSHLRPMQQNPKHDPCENPTPYAGEYKGPGTPPPSPVPPTPGGRFRGIGANPPTQVIPGGRFDGLQKREKAMAPCPKCHSWNTIVESGIFVCLDCDYEGG